MDQVLLAQEVLSGVILPALRGTPKIPLRLSLRKRSEFFADHRVDIPPEQYEGSRRLCR